MKTKTKQIIWAIILTLGLILFFATGCKSVQPVIVEPVSVHVGSYCEFEGDRIRIEKAEGDEIIIHDFEIKKSKYKKDNVQDSEFSYTLVGDNY